MSKLNELVTIHFKEDGIPSLRRGPLTKESKDAIKALFLELIDKHDPATGSSKPNSSYWGNTLRKDVQDL